MYLVEKYQSIRKISVIFVNPEGFDFSFSLALIHPERNNSDYPLEHNALRSVCELSYHRNRIST